MKFGRSWVITYKKPDWKISCVPQRTRMGWGRREKWEARKTHLNGTLQKAPPQREREREIREKESIKERRWERDEKEARSAKFFCTLFFLFDELLLDGRWHYMREPDESLKKEKLYSDGDVIWELDFDNQT